MFLEHLLLAFRTTRNRTYENSVRVSDQIKQPLLGPFGGSFFPSSIDLWNALSDSIRNEPNQHHFMKETVSVKHTVLFRLVS